MLKASAIDPDVARERGYRTVRTKAELRRLGFGVNQQSTPALLIPIRDVAGEVSFYQARADEPRIKKGKPLKYETPAGERMVLDVPRRAHADLGNPGMEGLAFSPPPRHSNSEPDAEHFVETPTVADFFARWVQDKVYPAVRRSQERDYRDDIGKYVLPRIGSLRLGDLTGAVVARVRDELLSSGGIGRNEGRPLAPKTVRNILGGSFRAMVGAAIEEDLVSPDPFRSRAWREWPRAAMARHEPPEADPFMPHERDRIVESFESRIYVVSRRRRMHLPFAGWVSVQFYAGLSPSEASGLQARDVMLDRGALLIRRSFESGRYGSPKTKTRRRTAEIPSEVVRLLERLRVVEMEPEAPLFPNFGGRPIEPRSFAHWGKVLADLGVRARGAYCMKDTFVTIALLAPDVNLPWLEKQTGVRRETLMRHYAKWFPGSGQPEFAKMRAFEGSVTPAVTPIEIHLGEGGPEKRTNRRRSAASQRIRRMRGGGLEPPRVLPH